MSRQKWYLDDFVHCGAWVMLFGTLCFGMCASPFMAKDSKNTTDAPRSKSTNTQNKIYTASTPQELSRIMQLYGRFNKQKTAQFGVFAHYNEINNMGN
jgi:hypothetical protein